MKRILSLVIAASIVVAPAASSATSDDEIKQLREQLASISQRLDELAAENARLRNAQEKRMVADNEIEASIAESAPTDAPAVVDSWSDRVRLDGDCR